MQKFVSNLCIFLSLSTLTILAVTAFCLYFPFMEYRDIKLSIAKEQQKKLLIDNFELLTEHKDFDSLTDNQKAKLLYTDQATVDSLYQMAKDVSEIFDMAKIKYSTHAGTNIGLLRHKGFIPWDDDIDLLILDTDLLKLSKLRPVFKKIGYEIDLLHGVYRIFPANGTPIKYCEFSKLKAPVIDVFIMHHNKTNNRIEFFLPSNIDAFGQHYYLYENFFPLKKRQFGPILLYSINKPEVSIERFYGKDWREKASIYPPHIEEKMTSYINITLSDETKSPALPSKKLEDRTNSLKKMIDKILN